MALGVVQGFLGREHALVLHDLYHTLVLSEECELARPEPIRSAVTNLCDSHHPMPNVYHGQCRGHMAGMPYGAATLADRFMGHSYRPDELFAYWQVLLCQVDEGLGHGIHSELAGQRSPLMAPQTIGHHQHCATCSNVVVEQRWS